MNISVISSHTPSVVFILINVLKYTFVKVYINGCFKKKEPKIIWLISIENALFLIP